MALFGAPLAHEDHAVRACYAALRMQDSLKRHAAELRRTSGISLEIRVGLNSGEVVVRSIGSDFDMDYAAVGHAIHLASRMEQAALPGSVVLTSDTLRLAEGFVEVRPLGRMPVKGMTELVEVYELTGIALARTRFQAATARGLTRFVGRDAELEQLRHAFERAAAGHGQAVAIVGEAGVGKSRLVYEFTHGFRAQDGVIIESGTVSYGKGTVYLPVIDLLKGYFKIQERDNQREIRDKVIGRLPPMNRSLEALLPPLLSLVGGLVEDPGWQALDPPQRRQRTLKAVKHLLLRESQVQPLLLVIEDLHWIDSETQALLDSLVDSLGSARVLLLVSYRPEYEHRWGQKTYYMQLRLETLPSESTGSCCARSWGTTLGYEPLKQMLRRRGNPFFLEEIVRTLVEGKALEGERGAYRLVRPVQSLQIPAMVQATLAARIDRLPAEEKLVLQTASVIGKDVPLTILAAIADRPEEALTSALAALQRAEFLYETSRFPDLEYTFKHALTHDVTYGSLLKDRRRILHHKIVEAVEALYPDRLAENVERLGYHALRGEVWGKAVRYLRQAGGKALTRSANREAVAFFEQSLAALVHLPEAPDVIEQAIDLRFDIRNALQPLGDLGRILAYLNEAEALATRVGDERRLGWVTAYLTEHHRMVGHTELAAAAGSRALDIAQRLGDVAMQVVTNLSLGLLYRTLAEYHRAIEYLRWNVVHLDGDLAHERFGLFGLPSVFSRTFSVLCLAELGEFAEGAVFGEESIRLAEAVDQPFSRVYAYLGVGALCLRKGELPRAIDLLKNSVAVARATHIPVGFVYAASLLGYALVLTGRLEEGLALLEEAVDQSAKMTLMSGRSVVVAYVGEAYLLSDRVADAGAAADQALQLAVDHHERGNEAYARRLAAEVAAARNDLSAAATRYAEALSLGEDLGMRPFQAHCHWGLARVFRRTGQRAAVEAHLATARTLFSNMDMAYWEGRLADDCTEAS